MGKKKYAMGLRPKWVNEILSINEGDKIIRESFDVRVHQKCPNPMGVCTTWDALLLTIKIKGSI